MFGLTLLKVFFLLLILILFIFGDVRYIHLYSKLIKYNITKNLNKIKFVIQEFLKRKK